MNLRQKLTVVVMDLLLLAELCISIFLAQQNPEQFTPVFIKSFFIMVIPTLVTARVAVRKLRTRESGVPA